MRSDDDLIISTHEALAYQRLVERGANPSTFDIAVAPDLTHTLTLDDGTTITFEEDNDEHDGQYWMATAHDADGDRLIFDGSEPEQALFALLVDHIQRACA